MVTRPDDGRCHVKSCDLVATTHCMHCGQPCCPAHIHHVSITWREDKRPPGTGATDRLPIHTETYALCPRCSTKPVPRLKTLPAL